MSLKSRTHYPNDPETLSVMDPPPKEAEMEFQPRTGPAVGPVRVMRSAAVKDLLAVHDAQQAFEAKVEAERAELATAKARALALQQEWADMVAERDALAGEIRRGELELGNVLARVSWLKNFMRERWLSTPLADHHTELSRQEFFAANAPAWIAADKTKLDALRQRITEFAQANGLEVPPAK